MRKFDHYFYLARVYYKENGNLLVPIDYTVDGYELGKWISDLRSFSFNYNLTERQRKLLDSIGMVWSLEEYRWNKKFESCVQYVIETDNIYIPVDCIYNDINIGKWIHNQKIAYRKGRLPFDRVKKLELISTPWDMKKSKRIEKLRGSITTIGDELECFTNKYDVDIIKSLLVLMLDEPISYDEIINIRNSLKESISQNAYGIFIVYSSGVPLNKISRIYSIDINEVEKIRLSVYKNLLEMLREKELIKTKVFYKRVNR